MTSSMMPITDIKNVAAPHVTRPAPSDNASVIALALVSPSQNLWTPKAPSRIANSPAVVLFLAPRQITSIRATEHAIDRSGLATTRLEGDLHAP